MPYDIKLHRNRVALRSDLTVLLTHLTRARPRTRSAPILGNPAPVPGGVEASALDVLMEILESGRIAGSGNAGYVIGDRRAACFQDTPLYSIGEMFYQEKLVKERDGVDAGDAATRTDFRYTLHGLSFDKSYVWNRGGRPVVYEQSDRARAMLPPDEWWRIVDMDLSDLNDITDWTHEREWRVPGDAFAFDLGQAFVVLPGENAYRRFLDHPSQRRHDFAGKVRGVIPVAPVLF